MDAIESINSYLDQDSVERILTILGFKGLYLNGNDVRGKCLVHGGNNASSFIFRTDIKLWYCHACSAYGDMVDLVERILNYNLYESCNFLAGQLGLDISNLEIRRKPTLLQKDIDAWFKFSNKKSAKEVECFDMPDVAMKKIVQFRSFQKKTLDKFGLYYTPKFPITSKTGEIYETKDKLLTPIWFNKKQVGIMLRRIKKDEPRKWIIQPTNLDKDNLLYNLEVGHFYDEIIIAEGIFDVWAFNEIELNNNALVTCLFGLHITDGQLRLLEQHTCNLTIALDGDEEGRKGVDKAIEKTKNKFNLKVINFAIDEDAENVTRHKLRNLYENKLNYIEWRKQNDRTT